MAAEKDQDCNKTHLQGIPHFIGDMTEQWDATNYLTLPRAEPSPSTLNLQAGRQAKQTGVKTKERLSAVVRDRETTVIWMQLKIGAAEELHWKS